MPIHSWQRVLTRCVDAGTGSAIARTNFNQAPWHTGPESTAVGQEEPGPSTRETPTNVQVLPRGFDTIEQFRGPEPSKTTAQLRAQLRALEMEMTDMIGREQRQNLGLMAAVPAVPYDDIMCPDEDSSDSEDLRGRALK